MKYKGYTVNLAFPTGGKAGKNCNKTTTLRVIDSNNCIVKQFRITIGDDASFINARDKAKRWIDTNAI